jgi:hypothetical protein
MTIFDLWFFPDSNPLSLLKPFLIHKAQRYSNLKLFRAVAYRIIFKLGEVTTMDCKSLEKTISCFCLPDLYRMEKSLEECHAIIFCTYIKTLYSGSLCTTNLWSAEQNFFEYLFLV